MQGGKKRSAIGIVILIMAFFISADIHAEQIKAAIHADEIEPPFIYENINPVRRKPITRVDNLLGDYLRLRSSLKDRGITPVGFYATTLQENVSGGMSRGFGYTGILNGGLEFDLEKILSIEGATFYFSGSWATGSNLSSTRIGNEFVVSVVFSGQAMRFYELWWDQKLHNNKIDVKVGRISPANDFGILPVFADYVTTAINGLPATTLLNDENFRSDPVAQWGARTIIHLDKDLRIVAGVYNAVPQDIGDDSKHGLDFGFRPDEGVLTVAELDYRWNQGGLAKGMPGQFFIGGFYDSSAQPTFKDPMVKDRGNSLFYTAAQQLVYQPNGLGTEQGLTVWGVYTYAPSQSVSLFTNFAAAGVSYKGLIPSREHDTLALGYGQGWFSPDEAGLSYESVVDLSYVYEVNKSLIIQPDVQYVQRPGGTGTIPSAWVVGVMMMLQF